MIVFVVSLSLFKYRRHTIFLQKTNDLKTYISTIPGRENNAQFFIIFGIWWGGGGANSCTLIDKRFLINNLFKIRMKNITHSKNSSITYLRHDTYLQTNNIRANRAGVT